MKTRTNPKPSQSLNVRSICNLNKDCKSISQPNKTNSAFTGRLKLLPVIALSLCTLAAVTPASASNVISDTVFNDADWTHSILWFNPVVTLGPVSQNLVLQDAGGNDGFQQGRHTSQGPFAGLYDGHMFVAGGTYNPEHAGSYPEPRCKLLPENSCRSGHSGWTVAGAEWPDVYLLCGLRRTLRQLDSS